MAAEVSADLALINDEDVLRRMWADTEDFGKKKEIRARMYKLREQRLKDFYTTGDVVTEVTGRKHLTKTHADSISDQGFITMKTKEIRDSESPTRDFSQRAGQGNGYWNSRQENTYASGTDDGARIEMKSNVTEGQGVIKEGNTETQMAMAAHNLHEKSEKSDENMSSKSEHHSHASKLVSTSKTDTGDSSSTVISSAQEQKQSSQSQSEQTSTTTSATSSTTKWSTSSTSSSKRVVSSSSSSKNYQITSGEEVKSIRDVDDRDYRVITSEDDSKYNRRFTDSTQDISRVTDNTTNQEQYQTSRIIKTSNRTSSTTSRDVEDSAPSTYIIRRVVYVTDDDDNVKTNDVNIQNTQIINEKRLTEQNERLHETRDVRDDSRVIQQQNIIRRDFQDQDEQDVVERVIKTSDTKKFITNEKYDTRRKDDTYVTDDVVDDTRVIRETRVQKTNQDDVKQSSTVERANRTDIETSSTVTDQKIMKEIHKLDSYLSSQSTAPSTPVSPQSVITDTANWTVVSSKDGEFVYKGEKPTSTEPSAAPKQKAPTSDDSVPTYRTPTPVQPSPTASTQEIPVHPSSPTPKDSPQSYQPRDKITKHPSSMDHPKEPTDGQYVTTYQQSYNRISVDNSASHEFFASTLRASPDRSTPSPTKRTPSRGSLDRSSPERRMRTPSKGSLDRSSPESKPRGSKGSLVDRTSPERKYKPTPTNLGDRTSPERKYKPTSPNYVDRTSPERKYKPISPNLVDRTSPERKYKPSPTNLSDRTSPERKYKPTSPNFVDRTSPERKYKPISPNLVDRTSPERKYKPSPTNLGDRTSPERKPKPTSTKLADRTSPERKYKPTPTQKTPDRERRGSAGTYSPDKTKDTRRKSTDTTRSNSLRETTTKTKRKFSSTQTKAANKARASTPGTSPSTSPTRKYRPKDTTTTTDSDSDVSHGTYKKSTTNITQDIDIQEKTTITSKKDTVVIDDQQDITDQESYPAKPTPRDKSPEYSSEGSVSREIRQNRIRDQPHDSSPERRAFAPIKPIPTTVGEQKDITVNLITNEKHLITNETDEVVEVTEKDNARPFREKPDEPDDDHQPRYDEQRVITETSVTTKRDDVKVTDVTNIETVQRKSPRSSTERIKDTSDSPERKTKPGRRSPSSSPSPERFQTRRPQQPSQTSKLVTKDHETTVFINKEKRHPSPEKTTDTTTKTTDIRRTSKEVTERLTRKPTQPSRPETTQSTPRSQSPRKKFSSPTESPERPTSSPVSSLSPDRPSSTRRPQQVKPKPVDTPTNVTRHIEVDTHKTTIRKVVSSDTPKTPKKSSIPRSESYKPVPKNQTPKGRPESIGGSPLRKPQTNAPSTPQKQRTPLIERTVVTVTKTTTISDKKPIGKPKDSPSQTSVRRIPSSPRKPATPASVCPAKSTPSYPRKENIPQQKRPKEDSSQITKITREIRRTSEQKENKRPTRPNVEPHQGRHPSSPGKDTKNVKTKKITEVTDFIEHEKPRDTSDIEDEAPPDEFFADTDDDTVPKSSEPLQRTTQVQNIKQTTSRTIKTATVESSEIKRPKDSGTPKKPTQTKPLSKTKQILKESTTINESPRKIKPDSQQKAPEDSDTSSDSEEELTEEVTVEETVRTTSRQVDQRTINQNSTQDLLNVIVQHPKSSRESSPGYPNARIPVCSTSEDGESIPRYADHISEPEDSDTLERKKPKPYADQRTVEVTDVDDEETVIHTSVADRVTEFLEAAKQTQEIQEQTQQVQIENSKSVLQTKALFENIAKNQTTIQVSTKPVNIYETQPETIPSSLSSKPVKPGREPQQKGPKKETSQPTKVPKPSTKLVEPEPSDDDDDETFEQTIHSTVTTKTSDSVNVQEQVNYEVDVYEEVEEHDTKTTKSSKPQEPSKISQKPKEPVQKPKEPTRKPQEPAHKKEPTASEPKKPLDRKPSGTTISVSSKKDFFERKAQDFDKPKAPLKENIIRSKPQKEGPQGIKPQKPESTEIPDSLTSVTERTESYLRSTVASSVRSQTPDKPHRRDSKPDVLDKLSPTKYEEPERPESEEPDDSVTTRTESYLRSTVASTVRSHTPDNLHRRGSKPDVLDKSSPTKPRESHRPESVEPIDSLTSKGLVAERTESYLKNTVASTLRRDSKPDVFDKPSSKHGRPQRPDSTEPQDLVTSKGLVTERTESYLRNTVASTVRSHTPDKPHRREPDVLDKSPSKYDEPEIPESVEPHDSVTTRSESYLRSTVASSVRSQTPDKPNRRDSKPDVLDKVSPTKPTTHEKSPTRQIDTGRKPSKPEEPPTRKSSKPTKPEEATKKPLKPEEITRKPSRPEEIVRRPSKPDELTRKPSKPEEIVRKPSKGEESPRRVSKDERPSSPNKKPKERSVSPLKSDERMKSPSKVIEVIKDVRKTSETSTKLSKPDDTVRRPYTTTEVIDDTKSISRVKDINTTFKRTEQTVEAAKEGKFGVTLRKTPSSTKVTTVTTTKTSPKKPLAPGELPEVEDIFDLEILEELLLRAVGYDERRRIRAQIRIVKKQLEEEYNTPGKSRTVTTTTTYTSTIPSVKDIKALSPKNTSTSGYVLRTTKVTTEETQKRRPERVSPERQVTKSPERPYSRSPERQSPERSFTTRQSQERQSPERRYIDTKKSETKTESVHTYRKDSLPKTESPERKRQDRQSPEKQVLKTTTTTTVEQRRSPERKPIIKPEQKAKQQTQVTERTTTTERRVSGGDRKLKPDVENSAVSTRTDKTQITSRDSRSEVYETSTTVKSQSYRQVTSETKDTCPTDSITSSYGVGPTDENGRPLFGLKALRRTNTNKSIGENELEEQQITVTEDETDEIYDSNGRPLFGLKALQATTEEDTMPAQTAQLRELVEKHQQYARESSAKETKPVQKPKAKLRDSFILTTDDEATSATTTTTTTTSHPTDDSTRGLSLRSIIKKHEQISSTGGKVESEMESRRTVVHSQSTVSSDGKVTHKRNIVHGEISSKNGEAPVGKITQRTFSYQTPDDKHSLPTIKSTIKTSAIGGGGNVQRRLSGPKIEEIKDDSITSSIGASDSTRRYSKEYTVDDSDTVITRNEVRRRSSDINEETSRNYTSILKSSKQDTNDWNTTGSTTVIRRTSGPKLTEFPAEDGLSSKVIRTTTTTTTKTIVSDKDDKRPLGRGDSVKALQHKFQQATEAANQATSRPYPPAGLILRSNSLQKNNDDQTIMSSALKQSNVERTDSRGRIQETKSREIITSSPVISTQVKTLEDTQTVKSSPTTVTRVTTITKGPLQEVTTTKVTEVSSKSSSSTAPSATSFLDDTSKVTGVQDILNRMRNADLVTESSDTSEDAEARALLNKFLGASVILQGMEQGMRSVQQHQHTTTTTTSSEAPSSAALVIQAEKQRVKDANTRTLEDDIDEISDEKQLRILLEACSDYEGRRKIRARLRTIMADHKDITDTSSLASSKDGGDTTKTEVHTTKTTTSTARLTKANSVQSPFAKFKQMERQNSAPSAGRGAPNYVSEPKVVTSVSYVKEHLLDWVKAQTRAYKNVQIENFSTSWSDGLAFCALIHHFCPNAFDYDSLSPQNRRYNFELAFRVAEEEDIYPLLDVEDMVTMRKPDWKCVFTYVQSVYRRFHNSPDALPANPYV